MRRVWIEIFAKISRPIPDRSPSMRRVWIEIGTINFLKGRVNVTLHAEGVD